MWAADTVKNCPSVLTLFTMGGGDKAPLMFSYAYRYSTEILKLRDFSQNLFFFSKINFSNFKHL